jgi:hypothetical protein
VSGPRRHRPTSLHLARPAALVGAVARKHRRPEGVRTGDGSAPLSPLDPADPASQRAIEAARKLTDAAEKGQND